MTPSPATSQPVSPASEIDITAHKVDIILCLMKDVRGHIGTWHGQIYTASIWSVGIFIGAAGYWIANSSSLLHQKHLFFVAVLFFGGFTQAYLWLSLQALIRNGEVLVRCEQALLLNKADVFLREKPFFQSSPSGKWVRPYDCIVITSLNFVILLFALTVISSY